MSKTFKPYSRAQQYLLPPSLQEWLPEGHLAYFIIEVVEGLDLSEVYKAYGGKDGRGHPPYDPRVMVALLLYAYCVGVPSSRQIEKRTYEDLAFRVVSANQHPDHDSICDFRKRHLEALGRLFLQVLRICQRTGLVKLGQVALDGTKVRANASKHKAMSYGRMKKAEEDLERQIWELFEKAEAADTDEDRRHGKGERGWDLVGEFRRRDSRLRKIREAMAALEEEARAEAARIIGVSDTRLWRVVQFYVTQALSKMDLGGVKAVALDETASKRGHNYVTVFIDLDRKQKPVIFVTPGKGKGCLVLFRRFLREHGGDHNNIAEVVCDMSPAFLAAIGESFPSANVTVDWFHVVQLFTTAVDEVRKAEAKERKLPKATKIGRAHV